MPELPYKIACLIYAFDTQGRVLLLHRRKPPNEDLYSPFGGKLEQGSGESPTQCAQRETLEEIGLDLPLERFQLTGLVTERAFGGNTHWMMYLYELTGTIDIPHGTEAPGEGTLEWFTRKDIDALPLPQTDREIIWPLFWQHRGGFFAVHINCDGKHGEHLTWQVEQTLGAQNPGIAFTPSANTQP